MKTKTKNAKTDKLTKHEKEVELAKASAPQYGIYIDGAGAIEKLTGSIDKLGDLVLPILESDTDDLVKLKAIELIESSIVPPVFNPNGVNVTMSK